MDDELIKARQTINDVNREIAELFEKRMEAAREVAYYKMKHGLPVLDSSREAAILEHDVQYVKDPEIRSYYSTVLQSLMDVSKAYQHKIMKGLKVAYSGVEGAFAQIAANRIFPDAEQVSYTSFEEAYKAVAACDCDCAVLPIENSYAGEVGQVMDLMYNGSLCVNGVYTLKISQNLLGVSGTHIEDVKTVISHPQALSQCAGYIRQHGFEEIPAGNTAVAAKTVAEKNDPTVAAIASAETAELYGLNVLDHDINASSVNTTRFAVFSRVADDDRRTKEHNFILIFTVNHVAGALSEAINVIARYGFNMKSMRSRPIKTKAWQYYFYVEAEGDDESDNGQKMLEELKTHCNMMKVIGHYSGEQELKKIEKGGRKI